MARSRRSPKVPDQGRSDKRPVRVMARLTSAVWWLLLVILVLFALYAGIGRQLTQNVNVFREDIAGALTAQLGHEVRIGRLSSKWFWLDPSFTAENIHVSNPDTGVQVLNLQHLTIRLDALASLLNFQIVFEDFQADGLEITLNQKDSGEVGVRGAEFPEPLTNRFQHWLELAGKWLSNPYVKVTRVNLGIRDNQGNLRHLDIPQLDLIYHEGLFRASGRAMQSATTQQLASFTLVGKHFFRGDFSGQAYLDVDSGRLFDGLIDEYQWRGTRIEGFDLGGEAWLTFRDGVLQQVNGRVSTPYLQLGAAGASLAPLEDISARFGWRRHKAVMEATDNKATQPAALGEWHLQDLGWTWNGEQVSPFSLKLFSAPDGARIVADALPVGPVRRLAAALPLLPAVATDALANYRPVGFMDALNIRIPGREDSSFELSARLRNVGVAAHDGAPAASAVNGVIYVDQHAGYVQARAGAQPVTLSFPKLFSSEWQLPELSATVAWQLDEQVTRVYADDIRLRYGDDTRLTGAFDLKLEHPGDNCPGESNLGLRIGLENGKGAMLPDFVPRKVVDADLYQWLTTAVEQADIPAGAFYGHGQIGADAPPESFAASMWYEFNNARVRYDEQWPRVSEASGRVAVHNDSALITLASAETGGLSLNQSTVAVVPQAQGTALQIEVSAPVPGSAVPYWLDNSPVGEMVGDDAGRLEYGGDYTLDLAIDLPLGNDNAPVVQADVSTSNGLIAYPEAGLRWNNISGALAYHTVDGFSGEPLTASFLGQPVQIAFSQPDKTSLRIRQSGSLSVREALGQAGIARPDESHSTADPGGNEADAGHYGLKGTFGYVAQLDVAETAEPQLSVSSSLQGLAIEWPGPFSKEAGQAAPLRAEIDTRAERGLGVSGTWEDRATFDLLWRSSGLELTLDKLYAGDQTLTNIKLEALDLGDRWVLNTNSERAVGRIVIPDNGDLVTADFAVLRLLRDENAARKAPELLTIEQQLEAFRAMDMANWPDIDIAISDLQLNDDNLGRWKFQLRPEHRKLRITGIEGHLKSLTLLGDMTWSVVNGRETSQFSGSITGGALSDLGHLLDAEIPLSNKQSNIELELDWPGRPDEFEPASLSGEVSARLDDGVILEQNNSAQLFRIFNLLNADTLWRRLKLDFSDLYERGVAFDAISGSARLDDGLLTMAPELQVVGPSGAFKLSGSTSLAEETLDMRLVVVLPLTQNLPLAALLMGAGAPIGGALFVLDKVLGDPLSRLTSATYKVSGTWDEPEVGLKQVFDTGE